MTKYKLTAPKKTRHYLELGGFYYKKEVIMKDSLSAHDRLKYFKDGWEIEEVDEDQFKSTAIDQSYESYISANVAINYGFAVPIDVIKTNWLCEYRA